MNILALSIRFQGRRRQDRYLERINSMDTESREAFARIYKLAYTPGNVGAHVSQAAIESVKHPAIFPLAKENLVIRVVLAIARRTQDKPLMEKMEESLEDFHVAADAFVNHVSIPESEAQRRAKIKTKADGPKLHPVKPQRTDDETTYLQQFIKSMKATIQKIKERKGE